MPVKTLPCCNYVADGNNLPSNYANFLTLLAVCLQLRSFVVIVDFCAYGNYVQFIYMKVQLWSNAGFTKISGNVMCLTLYYGQDDVLIPKRTACLLNFSHHARLLNETSIATNGNNFRRTKHL